MILFKLADKVRQNAAMLSELEARNTGKPIVEAEYDIADVATCFEYYGGLANESYGAGAARPCERAELYVERADGRGGADHSVELSADDGGVEAGSGTGGGLHVRVEACGANATDGVGICELVRGSGAAAGRGEHREWSGRNVAGAALVAHPGVDKIAFTGSAAVGKMIVKSAADTLKRVTLELGGKSPNIFFADADWEAAVDGALFGVFINQGEVCSAGSRVLVEKKIYGKFVEAMTEKAKRIKLGPPLERETKMGPLVSKEQYDRVTSYLEIGKKEAKMAIGGGQAKRIWKGLLRGADDFLRR